MHGIKAERLKSIRRRLILQHGPFCQLCQKVGYTDGDTNDPLYLTVGHIVSRAEGGGAVPSNFQLEHRACNEARGTLSMREYAIMMSTTERTD